MHVLNSDLSMCCPLKYFELLYHGTSRIHHQLHIVLPPANVFVSNRIIPSLSLLVYPQLPYL